MFRGATLFTTLLLAISLHAALGPGAEVPVSPAMYGVARVSYETRAVATDGTDFLTLWRDDTPGRNGLYATVLGEHRTLRPGSLISLLPEPIGVHAVWTGSHYLVTLTPYLQPTTALQLSRDGEIIAPARTIDLGGDNGIGALAWNGSRGLAIVQGSTGSSAVLLDAEGNVVRAGIPVDVGLWYYELEAAGDAFILVWTEQVTEQPLTTRALAMRITATGEVSDPVELQGAIPGYQDIAAASDGETVGVVLRTGSSVDTVIRRYTIDDALHVHAEAPLALQPYVTSNVAVVGTPRGFVAAYLLTNNDALRTIAFGSTTVDTIDLPASIGSSLRLESNGSAVVAFWGIYPPRATPFDARLTRTIGAPQLFPVAPVRQDTPVLASAGNTGLAAWSESGTLKVRILDGDGGPLDQPAITIATGVVRRAAAVFTGQVWLVAYALESDVLVQRLSLAGEPIGAPLNLGLRGGDVTLASNDSITALVVADGFRSDWLRLVRFSPSGERLDPTPISLTEKRSADHPEIATNGDGFLVVWSHSLGYNPRVVGKRLDGSGNPIDAEPFDIATGGEGFAHSGAKVASDGTDYVVAYVQFGEFVIHDPPFPDDPRPAPTRVFTKRVLATGVVADGTADQEGSLIGFGTNPTIIHDGERYVLTFTKAVTDTLWLFASTLDAKGAPVSVPRQLVRAESYTHEHGLAEIGGVLWSSYSRVVAELDGVQRVFLREVTEQTGRRRGSRN